MHDLFVDLGFTASSMWLLGAQSHDLPLITTIAAGFTAAWMLGLLTQKLGLSEIVGYLLAGVIISPYTPGYVGDVSIAQQLAELGVILLMFGVGLHFHLEDLLAVKGVAVPGALGQSIAATVLSILAFGALGLPVGTSAVLGMAIAVASTVVLMRVLMADDALHTPQGHIAVGWLLVEDVLTVIVLVLIPILGTGGVEGGESIADAGEQNLWLALGSAFLKLGVLVALVMFVGSRVIPWALVKVARLRSRELFTLTVLVFSIAIAAGAYVFFGASMALGAFLAGMVVAQSPVSHQAAADALPLRDAFAVLFFVAVGMLFDPRLIMQEPMMIVAALLIILVGKPLAALAIIALLGHSVRTALTVALALAQIGEFSFIVAELAHQNGLMPEEGRSVLVAAAILSITLNPLLFRLIGPIENWLQKHPRLWRMLNGRAERRALATNAAAAEHAQGRVAAGDRLAIVVGYGPVGRSVHRLLKEAGLATVVIEMNTDTVSELHAANEDAIYGDATRESILEQAGIAKATYIVVTLPQPVERTSVVTVAKNLNPRIRILVRARYLREREALEQAGATAAVFEEAEAAVALARLVLADTGTNREITERTVRDLRLQLIRENVANLSGQRVRSVMVPWTRVQRLQNTNSREEVLRKIGTFQFSRWPVVDGRTGKPIGYLLAKDLIGGDTKEEDWTGLIRPVHRVRPDDNMEMTLTNLQNEGATICIVQEGEIPVGLLTFEDILEQVVGRIEDEYPRDTVSGLHEALRAGSIVLDLQAENSNEAIERLASAIPPGAVPGNIDVAAMAIAREKEVSTYVGMGVAIPHARCKSLTAPLVIFGRSTDGIPFYSDSKEPVHLVFLLVTPVERPHVQLSLLAQLARIAGNASARESLMRATNAAEVGEILTPVDETPLAQA